MYNGRKSIRTSGRNLKYLLYLLYILSWYKIRLNFHLLFLFQFLVLSSFGTKKIQWKRYFTIRTSGGNPHYLLTYRIIPMKGQKLQNEKLQKKISKATKILPFLTWFFSLWSLQQECKKRICDTNKIFQWCFNLFHIYIYVL